MRKKVFILVLCTLLMFPTAVSANVLNYEATINTYKQDNKTPRIFTVDDGTGQEVNAVAKEDTLYVTDKYTYLRAKPGKTGEKLKRVILGTELQRVAVCDNGWSKVTYENPDGDKVIGYVMNNVLSDTTQMVKFRDTVKVVTDCDILDFPGRKDGEVIGEVLAQDEVRRTGTVNEIWSRIRFTDENGTTRVGYIPTSVLEGQEETVEVASAAGTSSGIDEETEAGTIHESEGKGIFAEAVEGVTAAGGSTNADGVQIGTPVAASSDATLVPLGTFRITHYCPCSICCGPWANGITSTGVIATTNHTIAVDPSQIPYGSKVVINGQVYVAEDCGGAIKTNCIDIYVASHAEGESKGVYYTDVYLLQE